MSAILNDAYYAYVVGVAMGGLVVFLITRAHYRSALRAKHRKTSFYAEDSYVAYDHAEDSYAGYDEPGPEEDYRDTGEWLADIRRARNEDTDPDVRAYARAVSDYTVPDVFNPQAYALPQPTFTPHPPSPEPIQ